MELMQAVRFADNRAMFAKTKILDDTKRVDKKYEMKESTQVTKVTKIGKFSSNVEVTIVEQ